MGDSANNNIGCTGFYLIIIVYICGLLFSLVSDYMINNGHNAEATIEQVWPGYKSNEIYVSYSFAADDIVYFGSIAFCERDSVAVGQKIKIKYQTNKPYKSKMISFLD